MSAIEKEKIRKLRQKLKKILLKEAKKQLKTNKKLKLVLQEINKHFKTNYWNLDYNYYREESGLGPMTFNAVLELKKYKIVYKSDSLNIVIRK